MGYKQIKDGEWVEQPRRLFIGCCDCGLVHYYELRKRKGKLEYRVIRDHRKTAAKRRARKYPFVPSKET